MKNTKLAIQICSFIVCSISACKQRAENSTTKLSESELTSKDINYLVLFAQGYNSCSQGYPNTTQHFNKVFSPYRVHVTYIESCFTGGFIQNGKNSTLNRNPGDDNLQQNGSAETLNYTITDPDGTITPVHEAVPASVASMTQARANQLSRPGRPTRVIMIGHSHGGWLVMKAARNWIPGADLRHLITIDPISYQNCTQFRLVYESAANITTTLSDYLISTECKMAPSDLTSEGTKIKANVSGTWTNYYQTQFRFIRSSAIAAATTNTPLIFTEFNAHRAMLSDKRVWDGIDAVIQADLKN